MSYHAYRGSRYRAPRYRHSRGRKSSDSPRTPYRESLEFVRKEFFNLHPSTFEQFLDSYGRNYGPNAQQYLRRTYHDWRSGKTGMAGQSERRILECVPPFLDREKQFQILAFYVPAIIRE